jgi:hypothetical protein
MLEFFTAYPEMTIKVVVFAFASLGVFISFLLGGIIYFLKDLVGTLKELSFDFRALSKDFVKLKAEHDVFHGRSPSSDFDERQIRDGRFN